ncbi:NHLP-related RiPP peptide [Thermomonas sp. S9]|uniref:NHLP-related RiPP peptide n=1 Tax=Thermomonas sp. S9 TaxID=2885203 RepID=UPI00216B4C7C|nr:NHLP-related RiPP peptide [Thermomonas sp. S9]MCR6494927.1 NHLP-related RiPP peptide [Thermomonas sp. S9]
MATGDKLPPAGLHPQLVKRLLDNLESNDAFRALFQQSPEQALRSLGYTDPWECLSMKANSALASPEQIRTQRRKLEAAMVGIQGMVCPLHAQGS